MKIHPITNNTLICAVFLLFFFAPRSDGQGIRFSAKSFNKIKADARAQDKMIFIDAYTTWCAPCKEMEKNVFTNQEVGSFYNSHFINAKFDMDNAGKTELGQYFPVNGYPCYIFIDANGAELHREYGYFEPQKFLAVANAALTPALRRPQPVVSHEIGSEELTSKDVALIKELFHLQEKIGHLVWENWKAMANTPLLYKTKKIDYLFNHPDPPGDFRKVYDNYWKGIVYVRKNTDSNIYQAVSAINNVPTVQITAPENGYNPCLWVLKASHELFHIFQDNNENYISQYFRGKNREFNELTFPFRYKDDAVLAACRVEAEYCFDLLKQMKLDSSNKMVAKKVFKDFFKIEKRIFADSLQVNYKNWMEWNEGVARYTEREIAIHVIDKNQYTPTADFTLYFKSQYTDTEIIDQYKSMLNPIRFVGEGVRGNVMFYYSGMGKALLLDSLNRNWKKDYFKKNLDQLIAAD